MFKTILLPIDLAAPELAGPAVAAALPLATANDAAIHLLYVLPPSPPSVTEFMPPDDEQQEIRSARDALASLARDTGLGASASITVRKGGVYHEIIEEAAERNADLIVMSSHRPAMRTYFLGSNAANVVRYAPCSVLVVRS